MYGAMTMVANVQEVDVQVSSSPQSWIMFCSVN